jgi:hypothetical protein
MRLRRLERLGAVQLPGMRASLAVLAGAEVPGVVAGAARTAEYRERRWARLEEIVRRVVREELELAQLVDAARMRRGYPVDGERGPAVDKRYSRARARGEIQESESNVSLDSSVGDAARPMWTAEDELFPGFRP